MKVEHSGRCVSRYICRKCNTTYPKKNIIQILNYTSESVVSRHFRTWTICWDWWNSALFGHQFATSSWELKCIWVLHHNKDQKHISKSTSEWIKMKVLEWTWIWVKCRYRAVYSWNISNVLNYSKSFITGYRKWIWVKRVRSQRTKASIRRRFTAVKRGHEHDKNSPMLYMKNNKLL